MSTRLQVIMSQAEYDEIRGVADRHRVTVSEWVRLTLREARERSAPAGAGALRAVRDVGPGYGGGPSDVGARVHVELDLNEELLEAVRVRYRQPNWRAAVEYALRRAAITPMTREEALEMRGAGWAGDLDALRSGDPGDVW